MKIGEGLLLLKDLQEEISRLRALASSEAWSYRTTDPDAKWFPNFNLEENHQKVRELSRLHRKLSRSIARANAGVDLDINDKEYAEWI